MATQRNSLQGLLHRPMWLVVVVLAGLGPGCSDGVSNDGDEASATAAPVGQGESPEQRDADAPPGGTRIEPHAWYSFDGEADTLLDRSTAGGSHDGTPVNDPKSVEDESRPAAPPANGVLVLDRAAEQFVSIPFSSELEPGTGPFSVTAWVQLDDSSLRQDVFSVMKPGGPYDGHVFRVSASGGNRTLFVRLRQRASGDVYIDAWGSTPLQDGTWHHVAYTWDGSGVPGGLRIYLDGVDDTRSTSAKTGPVGDVSCANEVSASIGNMGGKGQAGVLLGGRLDDVAVWRSCLGAHTIAHLHAGMPPDQVATIPPLSRSSNLMLVILLWVAITAAVLFGRRLL